MEEEPGRMEFEERILALEKELSECLHREKGLLQDEAKNRLLFSAESDAIIIVDAGSRRIADANEAALRLYGYGKEEFIGRHATEISAEPEASLAHIQKVASEKPSVISPGPVQRVHRKKDGTVFDVEISSGVYIFQNHKMICAIIRDITERKKAEQAIRESEERYRRMTEAVTDYTYTVHVENGRAVETMHGPGCVAVTGYTAEDFSANPYLWIEMVPDKDRRLVERQASRILSGLEVEPLEHRIIRKDGAVRWVKNTLVPRYRDHQSEVYYDGLIQDISERKHAEDALRESEARYREIVERTKSGVAVYRAVNDGEDFIFVDFNKAGERIEKLDRSEVIGKSVLEVFPGVKKIGLFDMFRQVWATGEPAHHPVCLYQDARIAGWRDNFVYKLPSGEIVSVYSDETERKRADEKLHRANEELCALSQELEKKVRERTKQLEERSNQLVAAERHAAMGRMANKIAHELRNSLMVVGGFSRRINETMPDDDPRKQYGQIVVREVMALERKVAEIINLDDVE